MFESGAFSEVADDELDGSPIGAGGLIGVLMAEGDATIDVSESFSTGEVAATGIRTDVHLGGFIGGVIAEAGSAISVSESFSTGEVSFSQPTLEGRRIDSDVIELSDIGMILGKVHVCGLVGTAQVGAMGGAATIEFSEVFSTVEIEITIRTDGFDISAGGLTGAATADGEVNEVRVELADYAPIVERLFGPHRYSTSVALSESRFEPGVPAVFLATGENYADALSTAAPARCRSRRCGAPVGTSTVGESRRHLRATPARRHRRDVRH